MHFTFEKMHRKSHTKIMKQDAMILRLKNKRERESLTRNVTIPMWKNKE